MLCRTTAISNYCVSSVLMLSLFTNFFSLDELSRELLSHFTKNDEQEKTDEEEDEWDDEDDFEDEEDEDMDEDWEGDEEEKDVIIDGKQCKDRVFLCLVIICYIFQLPNCDIILVGKDGRVIFLF